MTAIFALSPGMFDALRMIGTGAVTAHELGINGYVLKGLAERGFLDADTDGQPTIYRATPMGLGAIAVLTSPPKPIDNEGAIARIQRTVAKHFGISVCELTSDRRFRKVARPRQIAMYLSKQLTPKSLPAIGRHFNRDHTTVMHAIDTIDRLRTQDETLDQHVELLTELLKVVEKSALSAGHGASRKSSDCPMGNQMKLEAA